MPDKTVLIEANEIMTGDRQELYGDPVPNMEAIGQTWAAMLGIDAIPPQVVAMMFVAYKALRQCRGKSHHDNLVDAAAYIRIAELADEEQLKPQPVKTNGFGSIEQHPPPRL